MQHTGLVDFLLKGGSGHPASCVFFEFCQLAQAIEEFHFELFRAFSTMQAHFLLCLDLYHHCDTVAINAAC